VARARGRRLGWLRDYRVLTVLAAMVLFTFAAPQLSSQTWSPFEIGDASSAELSLEPMPFEQAGQSFPGSAFYYLAPEADTAAKVPAPVVEVSPSADDKSKSFAERSKAMSSQKVGLAIATITGMSLLTKVIAEKAKAPPAKLADATPPEGQIKLLREPASPKKTAQKPAEVSPAGELSPEQLLTPVKIRKRKGSN
jgi:hypothetical protein